MKKGGLTEEYEESLRVMGMFITLGVVIFSGILHTSKSISLHLQVMYT